MKTKIEAKYLVLGGLILLYNLLFLPPLFNPRYQINEGEVATFQLIAPYDFDVPRSEQELNAELSKIIDRIPPVYDHDPDVTRNIERKSRAMQDMLADLAAQDDLGTDTVINQFRRHHELSERTISYLIGPRNKQTIEKITKDIIALYSTGVIDQKMPNKRVITIAAGSEETPIAADQVYSIDEAKKLLSSGHPDEYGEVVGYLLVPNLIYNDTKTRNRIDEVYSNVKKIKETILKGEIIAEKHKRVTGAVLERVRALEQTYTTSGIWEAIKVMLFRNLLLLASIFLLYKTAAVWNYQFITGKNLYFIAMIFAGYLSVGKIMEIADLIYLLPISFFVFLLTLYFDLFAAMIFTIVGAALIGVTLKSLPIFVYLFVSGSVAAFSTQSINSRLAFYRPMIYIGIANVVAILFADLYLIRGPFVLGNIGTGILNSIIGSFSFVLLLPLLERIFDFTTDLTLLELGNLNLPLFKEMAIEAPGTYHHSLVTGSLAESAARAIGADPILTRVGAYYHDIGKLRKPEYFIENQIGGVKNPHDSLKPQMSALVIISHVKDGLELAKRLKLPRKLRVIIEQHHGTTAIELFYKKAINLSEDTNEDIYRYPGPKPKSKEAALVMLADTVEATARSDKNITVNKLQRIVKDSIEKKFNDGQLDECPIHRQDLEAVKTAFLSILTGVFHPRVDYRNEQKHERV